MLWFFQRDNQVLRLETRIDTVTGAYVVVIEWADRPPETERYTDLDAYEARLRALEQRLEAEHWTQLGGPKFLPDGWRGGTGNH
jgi:hypothetical protein